MRLPTIFGVSSLHLNISAKSAHDFILRAFGVVSGLLAKKLSLLVFANSFSKKLYMSKSVSLSKVFIRSILSKNGTLFV